MARKKNPEQEAPPAQDQEPENPTEQEETPEEETPTQEEQPQEQETEEQEDAEDPEEEEEDPQEEPEEEEPEEEQPQEQTEAPTQEPAADETAALRSQLLNAQGRLAAYAAGVAPEMVDDAVTLAMAEAAKSGEVTEASVNSAMDAVLKRHPEWKADGTKKKNGGFKIGADRDNAGFGSRPSTTSQNVKRWNRFK